MLTGLYLTFNVILFYLLASNGQMRFLQENLGSKFGKILSFKQSLCLPQEHELYLENDSQIPLELKYSWPTSWWFSFFFEKASIFKWLPYTYYTSRTFFILFATDNFSYCWLRGSWKSLFSWVPHHPAPASPILGLEDNHIFYTLLSIHLLYFTHCQM